MKINIFKPTSGLYPLRWFFVFMIALAGLLAYADYTGWRLLSFSKQESWGASGPGQHK